ncbi:hypothetical protein [Larkinella insperata]
MQTILEICGATFGQVVKMTIYLVQGQIRGWALGYPKI